MRLTWMVPTRWTRNVFTLVPSGSTTPVNVSGMVGGAGVGVTGAVGSLHADALSARPSTTAIICFIVST